MDKQARLKDGAAKLKSFGASNDDDARRRRSGMIMFVVVPLLLVCVAVWFGFGGGSQQVASAELAKTLTPVSTRSLLGGAINQPQSLGGGSGGSPVSTVPLPRLRCYALRDTRSMSGTVVFASGLFFADGYSRVRGGLVYSRNLGWFPAGDFGCVGDLQSVEREFDVYPTPIASPTIARVVPVRVFTQVPTVAIPTVVPSPTFVPGIARFTAEGCRVTWFVSGVQSVYLEYGGKSYGVPGENNGLPMYRDLCPYVGMVNLIAINGSARFSRVLEIK